MPHPVSITELWLYPVKSLPGIAVSAMAFDQSGPVDDRRWMLVDHEGRFISQRGTPMLARFAVEPDRDGYRIAAPDGDTVILPRPTESGQRIGVSIWKDSCQAWEVSGELSAWFSAKLGRPVHLVHVGLQSPRLIRDPAAEPGERVGFADGYPLLVCNQGSLDRLTTNSGMSLGVKRFRPNLVIEGAPADAELALGTLAFTQGRIDLLKTCVRCNVPAIDPATANYEKPVAAVIKEHCQWQGQTVFGVNGVARGLTTIEVGDSGVFHSR